MKVKRILMAGLLPVVLAAVAPVSFAGTVRRRIVGLTHVVRFQYNCPKQTKDETR